MEGLNRDAANLLEAYIGQFSRQALGEVVLHQLRPQDLALATTMGLEPGHHRHAARAGDNVCSPKMRRKPRWVSMYSRIRWMRPSLTSMTKQ